MSQTKSMEWTTLLNPRRRRKSNVDNDHRVEFERDYDRTIFSTPVKRLQDKAQVFPMEPNDAIRTRLTHSLEVAAVARSLATKASGKLIKDDILSLHDQRSMEAIASTCALIHDLGNPPFGHAGEDAIRTWFRKQGLGQATEGTDECFLHSPQYVQDFLNFEGNAQTLRIVSKLQILADFYGLNLTYGTLSASCKYTAPSHLIDPNDQARKKPGFFASENDTVHDIRESTGTNEARNPITFLVEAADDIVYSVADIEDAIKKGVLSWNNLEVRFRQIADPKEKHDAQSQMTEVLAFKDKILGGANGCHPDDAHASAFRTAAIGFMVPHATESFEKSYDAIMKGEHKAELVASPVLQPFVKELKAIGKKLIYPNSSTVKLEMMGRRIIHDLMDFFWEGAKNLPIQDEPTTKDFAGRIGTLLSSNYRRVFVNSLKDSKLPEIYHRYQLVTDYVCGMTDSFAVNLHRELFNG